MTRRASRARSKGKELRVIHSCEVMPLHAVVPGSYLFPSLRRCRPGEVEPCGLAATTDRIVVGVVQEFWSRLCVV